MPVSSMVPEGNAVLLDAVSRQGDLNRGKLTDPLMWVPLPLAYTHPQRTNRSLGVLRRTLIERVNTCAAEA